MYQGARGTGTLVHSQGTAVVLIGVGEPFSVIPLSPVPWFLFIGGLYKFAVNPQLLTLLTVGINRTYHQSFGRGKSPKKGLDILRQVSKHTLPFILRYIAIYVNILF